MFSHAFEFNSYCMTAALVSQFNANLKVVDNKVLYHTQTTRLIMQYKAHVLLLLCFLTSHHQYACHSKSRLQPEYAVKIGYESSKHCFKL